MTNFFFFFLPGKNFSLTDEKQKLTDIFPATLFFFFFYYSVINTWEKTLRIRLNRCLLPLRASVKNEV